MIDGTKHWVVCKFTLEEAEDQLNDLQGMGYHIIFISDRGCATSHSRNGVDNTKPTTFVAFARKKNEIEARTEERNEEHLALRHQEFDFLTNKERNRNHAQAFEIVIAMMRLMDEDTKEKFDQLYKEHKEREEKFRCGMKRYRPRKDS